MTLEWTGDKIAEHVNFWRLSELNEVIESFESEFGSKINLGFITAYDYKNVLLWAMAKSILTLREVLCLSTYGYPDGALSLSRNIYEQFITVLFLENHREDSDFNDYISDYFIDPDIQRYDAFAFDAEFCHLNGEKLEEYRNKKREIKSHAHHSRSSGGYWWTGKGTLTSVVEECISSQEDEKSRFFLADLHVMYKRACLSLHASCLGNMTRLGVPNEYPEVNTLPQTGGFEISLYLSCYSFYLLVRIVCREFEIDENPFKDKLEDLIMYYHKILRS